MPSPASPAISAKAPRPITNTPADLKKSGAYFDWANEADPNDKSASIGSVPRANAPIIKVPEINEPLDSDATCMA